VLGQDLIDLFGIFYVLENSGIQVERRSGCSLTVKEFQVMTCYSYNSLYADNT
jgi:hypothetical protein